MRRIIALVTAAVMMTLVASPVQAQIQLHRHLLTTPGASDIELARGICKQELLDPTLENVHENFHLGQPTAAFAEENNKVSERAAPCP